MQNNVYLSVGVNEMNRHRLIMTVNYYSGLILTVASYFLQKNKTGSVDTVSSWG